MRFVSSVDREAVVFRVRLRLLAFLEVVIRVRLRLLAFLDVVGRIHLPFLVLLELGIHATTLIATRFVSSVDRDQVNPTLPRL